MTIHYRVTGDVSFYDAVGEVLRNDGTVIFPTETVYGLGANGLSSNAVKKIFAAKGRPADNPLILHIAAREWLDRLTRDVPQRAMQFIETFWPGPLTLIFKRSAIVPDVVTAGLDTVAIRMPSDPVARAVIEAAGVPIAAPSANLSGKPSPTRAEHVLADMMGKVDVIVTDGDVEHGLESTVLDVSKEPYTLLRPGTITLEQLLKMAPDIAFDETLLKKSKLVQPRAPGMKYRHYAPNAEVYVIDRAHDALEIEKILDAERTRGKKVHYVDMAAEDLVGQLFAIFRNADAAGYDVVFVKSVATEGVGLAVMNRLLKAADYKIL